MGQKYNITAFFVAVIVALMMMATAVYADDTGQDGQNHDGSGHSVGSTQVTAEVIVSDAGPGGAEDSDEPNQPTDPETAPGSPESAPADTGDRNRLSDILRPALTGLAAAAAAMILCISRKKRVGTNK